MFHVLETFSCHAASQARRPSRRRPPNASLRPRASLLALASQPRHRRARSGQRRLPERRPRSRLTFWQTMNDQETRDAKDPRRPVRGVAPRHQDRHGHRAVRSARPEVHDRRAGGPGARHHAGRHRPRRPGLGGAGPAHRPDVDGLGRRQGRLRPGGASRAREYNGKIYAVPQTVDALALFYNKTLFKQAGLTKPPATLAQLQADCQKFGNGKGIALRGDSYWIGPWIWGYGGGLVNMAKKQILIGSKKSIAGWSAYNALFQNKCAFPDKDFSNDYGNVHDGLQERPGRDDRERAVVDRGRALGPGVQEARPTSGSPCSRRGPAARARRSAARAS